MASQQGDRHAKDQLNIRVPADFLARLKEAAKRPGQTQTDIVVRGTAAELDRLDGIAAPAPAVFVAAEDEQPQQAAPRAHALNCKCGICKTRKTGA